MVELSIKVCQGLDHHEVRGEEVISLEADFAAETWTFRINPTTRVSAGRYMLIRCSDLMRSDPTDENNGRK